MEKNTNEEIDLSKLIKSIYNGFYNIIYTLLKRIYVLIALTTVITVVALILFFISEPVVKANMTVSSKYITNEFCFDLLETLNNLAYEQNYNQLSYQLGMSLKNVQKIKKIEFKNFNEKYEKLDQDTILLGLPFKIEVIVTGPEVLDTLQTSLVNYLANQEYVKIRERINKQNLTSRIESLHSQIMSMDSLKQEAKRSLSPRAGGAGGFVFGQPYEPLNIYRENFSFFQKELDFRKELELSKSFEVINGFTKLTPKRSGLLKTVGFSILASIAIYILLTMFLEILIATKKYEKEHDSIVS